MNFAETQDYLCNLRTFGVRPGLENTRAVMAALRAAAPGLPEPKFLHVAGTNGKGSTCAFLDSILREAGIRRGLFTSPHLVRLTERIRIDGAEIGESRFCELAALVRRTAEAGDIPLTFFEYLTLVAWEYFREEKVPCVVWETGLGGRLDATSAQEPFVTAITNIGLEHTQYLGDTIEQIAAEKAGILRPGIPNFTTAASPAREVIAAKAAEIQAPSTQVSFTEGLIEPDTCFVSLPEIGLYNAQVGLLGRYQCQNAALAAATAAPVLEALGIQGEARTIALLNGLKKATWPGRLQILRREPLLLLDCAHNPHGWEALKNSLEALRPGEKWHFYFGMLAEKHPREALELLGPLATTFAYIEPQNPRKLSCAQWRSQAGEVYPGDPRFSNCYSSAREGLRAALESTPEKPSIICGSCYLAGEILALLENVEREALDDPVGREKQ